MNDTTMATMPFTADFTAFSMNNAHEWAGSTGGSGVKRQNEIEAETIQKDNDYQLSGDTRFDIPTSKGMTMGDFSASYGNNILTNMARDSQVPDNFMTQVNLDGNHPSSSPITVDTGSNFQQYSQNNLPQDMATTPAILPSDMTTYDRLNATSMAYDVGSLTNPNTLGDSLSSLIEKVHDQTQSYEESSDMLANKSKGSAFDRAKDSFISEYDTLSGGLRTRESKQSAIDRQIETYIGVMNSSYEYALYASGFVDVGKSISQTAQTLTKG